MPDIVAIGALDGLRLPAEPAVASVSDARIEARLAVRGAAEATSASGAAAVRLPSRINSAEVGEGIAALKLGPDEWLILGRAERLTEISRDVRASEAPHSLVDITHRHAGLIIEGPRVEDVLSAGCPLPLALRAFPVGRATRTLFAKAEIVLWRQAETRFHIEVGRSIAPYLVALLGEVIEGEAAMIARA